jgi:hypothetical protein
MERARPPRAGAKAEVKAGVRARVKEEVRAGVRARVKEEVRAWGAVKA